MTHTILVFGGLTYLRHGDGRTLWEYPHSTRDGWALGRGRYLLALSKSEKYPHGAVVEVDQMGRTLFEFAGTQDEVNTVQDIGRGRVLLVEAGQSPRLLEIDRKRGKIAHEVPLKAQISDTHLQTRMTRKLRNGNYLVPQAREQLVREYTPAGQIVWQAEVPGWAFTAIRLDNGNTLVGCTMAHTVVELDRAGKVVWQVTNDDLQGRPLNDCCGVQRLPNGNTVITSYRAPANEVRLTEVTREKQIVWQHRDSGKPGIHHFQILDTDGRPVRGRPLR
jgi:hypothetical protein